MDPVYVVDDGSCEMRVLESFPSLESAREVYGQSVIMFRDRCEYQEHVAMRREVVHFHKMQAWLAILAERDIRVEAVLLGL